MLLLFYREIWDWVLAIVLICGESRLCYIPLKSADFQQAIKLLRLQSHFFFSDRDMWQLKTKFSSFFLFLSMSKTVFGLLYTYVVEGSIRGHPDRVTTFNSGFLYFVIIAGLHTSLWGHIAALNSVCDSLGQ